MISHSIICLVVLNQSFHLGRLLFIGDGLHATGSLHAHMISFKKYIIPANPPVEREWIQQPTESILIYAVICCGLGSTHPKTLLFYISFETKRILVRKSTCMNGKQTRGNREALFSV